MPLYEFNCQQCQKEFEVLGSFAMIDQNPPDCSHCGSQQTIRKISRVAIFSKGNGNERPAGSSSCGSCSASPSACASCGSG